MWPDRVSNPGPLTYESGALPTELFSLAAVGVEVGLDLTVFVTGCRSWTFSGSSVDCLKLHWTEFIVCCVLVGLNFSKCQSTYKISWNI